MEETLKTYEGPAVIDGEEVPNLRVRVFATYDDGVAWPDIPVELLRGWEAVAAIPRADLGPAQEWVDARHGVEVQLPGVPHMGRAIVTDVQPVLGEGWTVFFIGAGVPPVADA